MSRRQHLLHRCDPLCGSPLEAAFSRRVARPRLAERRPPATTLSTVPIDVFSDGDPVLRARRRNAIEKYRDDEGFIKEEVKGAPVNEFQKKGLAAVRVSREFPWLLLDIVIFCVETLPISGTTSCVVRFASSPAKIGFFKNIHEHSSTSWPFIPYFITLARNQAMSLAVLRVIRLVRFFRIFKTEPPLQGDFRSWTDAESIRKGSSACSCSSCSSALILFSSAVYFAEADSADKSHFDSSSIGILWLLGDATKLSDFPDSIATSPAQNSDLQIGCGSLLQAQASTPTQASGQASTPITIRLQDSHDCQLRAALPVGAFQREKQVSVLLFGARHARD
uniref:Phosducin domain-containing protein n=1 Tax=Macrostomum lignano TaxID=282301 RepID=A0A1I8JPE4_9PLAT